LYIFSFAMPRNFLPTSVETAPASSYSAAYYLGPDGQPRSTFSFDPARDLARAQAIADTGDVPHGGRILDYGCGLGTMTAAFGELGYDVTGVDPSSDAIENALPEARGLVRCLGDTGLAGFPDGEFDLVVAKDVFEHIEEDKLHDLTDEMLRIGQRILAIIPVVDKDRKFIFEPYDHDPTHITRLTRNEWLGFFVYTLAQDREELTPQIRRPDKVDGTLSLLLEETDPRLQRIFSRSRPQPHPFRWPRFLRRS
jgi:SAM-dependent methyltransferase